MRVFSGMSVTPRKPAQPTSPKTPVLKQPSAESDQAQFSGKRPRPIDHPPLPDGPPPKRAKHD